MDPQETFNPFTPEHCDCMTAVLESSAKLRDCLLKCQEAGLNMTEQIERNEAQAKLAADLKSKFFPNVP